MNSKDFPMTLAESLKKTLSQSLSHPNRCQQTLEPITESHGSGMPAEADSGNKFPSNNSKLPSQSESVDGTLDDNGETTEKMKVREMKKMSVNLLVTSLKGRQ